MTEVLHEARRRAADASRSRRVADGRRGADGGRSRATPAAVERAA